MEISLKTGIEHPFNLNECKSIVKLQVLLGKLRNFITCLYGILKMVIMSYWYLQFLVGVFVGSLTVIFDILFTVNKNWERNMFGKAEKFTNFSKKRIKKMFSVIQIAASDRSSLKHKASLFLQ